MRRTIVQPADVNSAALAELKDWLGISRTQDDDLLAGLMQASLAMCEAFTGQAALLQITEESVPLRVGSYPLVSRPVTAVLLVETVAIDGARTPLPEEFYAIETLAPGEMRFDLHKTVDGQSIAIRLETGLAPDWERVPAALKQGLIRLAAFYYRDRDRRENARQDLAAPASVTALWRPWRAVRLS